MEKEDNTSKKRFEKLREGYKSGKGEARHSSPDSRYSPQVTYNNVDRFLKDTAHWENDEIREVQSQPKFYASLAARADELMKIGSRPEFKDGGGYLLKGAELYMRIGRGNRAIKRLQRIAEADEKGGNFGRYKTITDFVKKYETQHQGKRSGEGSLAGRISAFVFLIVGLASMLVQDGLVQTGNIIGSGTKLDIPFLLSLLLMVIGGALLFISLKDK